MKNITIIRKTTLALSVAAIGAGLSAPAHAFKFDMENGIQGAFDSTISYGIQMRLKSPNTNMIGNDNGGSVPNTSPLQSAQAGNAADPNFNYTQVDDGNLNYKKGDVVSSVLKGTHELSLKEQGNWAVLGRVTWSTDFAAEHTARTPLDNEAKRAVRQDISLLDLWVSKDFKLGDNSAKFKLGNQVISWGEDLFIFGGVNSINAFDLRKAHIPGTQLKEIFIPAPMASINAGLGNGFSMEAYYQFMWNSFKLDPAGTFWSTADFLGKGGKRGAFFPQSVLDFNGIAAIGGDYDPTRGRTLDFIAANGGVIPVERKKPSSGGQYGLNLRFKPSQGETEYAGYYIRYHDKLPFVGYKINGAANAFGITAVEQYGQDLDLYGVSMNTKVGDWAFGAELSYRPKDSVAVDPTVPATGKYSVVAAPGGTLVDGFVGEKKYQAQATAFTWIPPEITRALGAADGYFMGEVAFTRYPGLKLDGSIPYLLNDYSLPTKNSWGYVTEFGLTYANIGGSGWTMAPVLDFYHDVKGVSPNTIPFIEGRKAVAFNLNFDYHNQWKVGVGYTTFFGGGNLNLMRDRDVLSGSVSYAF